MKCTVSSFSRPHLILFSVLVLLLLVLEHNSTSSAQALLCNIFLVLSRRYSCSSSAILVASCTISCTIFVYVISGACEEVAAGALQRMKMMVWVDLRNLFNTAT